METADNLGQSEGAMLVVIFGDEDSQRKSIARRLRSRITLSPLVHMYM
jgi:hypothetical protein